MPPVDHTHFGHANIVEIVEYSHPSVNDMRCSTPLCRLHEVMKTIGRQPLGVSELGAESL